MDGLQQHHHHQRFMGTPAPPSMSGDSQQPQRPPLPPQGPWYSGQFQYQPAAPQPSPPPPAPATMWPHHSDQQQSHLPPHYSSHPPPQQHGGNYLPPHPPPQHHMPSVPQQHPYSHPPPPPPPPPHPHGYPQQHSSHQTWGNPNWVHNQGWEHPDRSIPNNNEEEWAARARAWAAAKAAMENQHLQPQFAHLGGPEDHNHVYHEQYQQAAEPHYTDIQQPPLPHSSHQQLPASLVNPHGQAVNHMQETPSFSAGPSSSYVSEGHLSYTTRDGAQAADSTPAFHHQGNFPTNSSVYQQEVSSSYSSASGKEEAGDANELFHAASTLPASSPLEIHHHMQPTVTSGSSVPGEQPHFTFGNRLAESMIDPSDQPLEFAPGFNRNHGSHDQHPHASYRHTDAAGSVEAPIHALTTPPVPGVVYPPIPTVPSGLQFDSSFVAPPVPGQAVPMFGHIPGSNFRPTIPPVSASFGLGAGATLHLPGAFPGDANGVSNVPDHPKKASVPNWLREEIIKKAVNTSSSQGHHVEDRDDSNEDGGIEKSFTKAGQMDNKSNGSSIFSDDEDDDEDEVEAARTAAINQEIKRVLTEVLLKVTDELFDEIANKVLSEDNLTVEVDHITPSNHKVSPSPPAVPTPKASAKVLIPVKTKEPEVDGASGQSSSGSPGDVLGLANYASDDDEENQSSRDPTTGQMDSSHLQSSDHNRLEVTTDVIENGNLQAKTDQTSGVQTNSNKAIHKTAVVGKGLTESKVDKDLSHGENIPPDSLKEGSGIRDDRANVDGGKTEEAVDSSRSGDIVGGQSYLQSELPLGDDGRKSTSHVAQGREVRSKSEKSNERVSKSSSSGKESVKQVESRKIKVDEKHSGSSEPRRDERHLRKERMDDKNSSKERIKDRGTKSGEKVKEIDLKKSSNNKDDKRESDKVKRASSKDDSGRKRDRDRDEKEDSVHHRTTRDLSRHKRRRSPSTGGRGRDSKDDSFGDHAKESSEEDSENSRQRKRNSRKRSSSPSPTRSRRRISMMDVVISRHVSRSPHSKHSQRRHSPYSSLEGTRGRRSRSNSPVRRRR